LGAPELAWRSNGDEVWSWTISGEGLMAGQSGGIGDYEVTWLETTVSGPGTISFQWKVSSEMDADFLTFSIDGSDQPGRISGEVDWQPLAFRIPTGTHLLRWTYGKNALFSGGADAAWLRKVVLQASP